MGDKFIWSVADLKLDSGDTSSHERELADQTLRRISHRSGSVQLPSGSHILDRLYNDHGVRVRMVRRTRPNRIPTVKELIDHLSKKHERLLEMEGTKIDAPANVTPRCETRVVLDKVRCLSETPEGSPSLLGSTRRDDKRCGSEKQRRAVNKKAVQGW